MIKEIYLAAGCFWGAQKYFDQFEGVMYTEVGYANGSTEYPSYEDVKYKHTGHAETVKVVYDDEVLRLESILKLYFFVIDPYTLNQQGEDKGVQYRTGIYYNDEKDLPVIRKIYDEEQAKSSEKFVVEVKPLLQFFSAEEYHQKYLEKNVNGYCHISGNYFKVQEMTDKGEFKL